MSMSNVTESLRQRHEFYIADYVVFGLAIFISLAIGVFHGFMGRRKNNADEYLVGGRSMSILPTAISTLASFESSVMMLGSPAEAYNYGFQYIWWIFGMCLSLYIAVTIVVPVIHPMQITSAYEYLELRFKSKAIRLLGTALGTISYVWYIGVVLFGPAIALEAVTGYAVPNTIAVITLVGGIYTSIGGLKAVIWTDVFQALVMLVGILAILIQGTIELGGPRQVWETARAGGRTDILNFDPDPTVRHTFWCLMLGSLVRGAAMVFNQSSVQRISSTKSVRDATRMLQYTTPAFFVTLGIALYEGIVTYAYHQHRECDPMASKQITDMNQIIPYTVMDIFSKAPGMPGLFIAAIFCAALSTLSSGLASVAALTWTDIIHPLVGDISESKSTIIIKFTGDRHLRRHSDECFFLVAEIGSVLTEIAGSLVPSFTAPLFGIFVLGCFSPRTNAKGAMLGGIVTFAVCIWISLGQSFSPNLPKAPKLPPASTDKCFVGLLNSTMTDASASTSSVFIAAVQNVTVVSPSPRGIELIYTISYQYIAVIGTFGSIILGYLASFIFGANQPGDVDPRYLVSFSDSFLWFLPGPVRSGVSSRGPQFIDDKYRENDYKKVQRSTSSDGGLEPKITLVLEKPNGTIDDKSIKSYDMQMSHKF